MVEEKDFEKVARRWVGPEEEFKLLIKAWNSGTLKNRDDIQRLHNPSLFPLEVLFNLLKNRDPEIRERAAEVLAYRRENEAYDAIVEAEKRERNPIVKFAMKRALEERKKRAHIAVLFGIPAEAVRGFLNEKNR